jgi:Na+-driven multidrug efflux pump
MVEMVKSDLTVGSIPEHFYRLALPMAIGMVFYTLYNMVGIYFAGKLSTSAQAGIGIGHLVYFFLIAFGFGLNAAMAGLVGNSLGEKKISEAKVLIAKGISLAIFISKSLFGLFEVSKLSGRALAVTIRCATNC